MSAQNVATAPGRARTSSQRTILAVSRCFARSRSPGSRFTPRRLSRRLDSSADLGRRPPIRDPHPAVQMVQKLLFCRLVAGKLGVPQRSLLGVKLALLNKPSDVVFPELAFVGLQRRPIVRSITASPLDCPPMGLRSGRLHRRMQHGVGRPLGRFGIFGIRDVVGRSASCELSIGCPSGPDREGWSCDTSAESRGTG
jgi:hypothetical protein